MLCDKDRPLVLSTINRLAQERDEAPAKKVPHPSQRDGELF